MFARMAGVAFAVAILGEASAWAQSSPQQPPILSEGQVIVVVPRSRDSVLAYSHVTGRWCKQPIKATPETPILPVVADQVAAFQIGNEVFAFSAAKCRWKSVSLPGGSKASFVVDSRSVTIQAGGLYYVFSPKTCEWSSVNWENGEVDPKERNH